MNTLARADNKHGLKGVWFNKRAGKWATRITVNGKSYGLGRYDTPQEASLVYRAVSRIAFGQYAPASYRREEKQK